MLNDGGCRRVGSCSFGSEAWGAGLPGSPVIGFKDTLDRFALFMIPVGHWSDGTAASVGEH
jgi:hypothetical protein